MDKEKIQKALKDFRFYSSPSIGTHSDPATIQDIRNLIKQTEKLILEIVKAIDLSYLYRFY